MTEWDEESEPAWPDDGREYVVIKVTGVTTLDINDFTFS